MKRFYDCGICGHVHPWNWSGDCRDDANRFFSDEVPADAELFSWEDRCEADERGRAMKPEKLDVLFRKRMGEITAVFPSECGTDEYDFTCYAHVGQHGSASRMWYTKTRKAKPAEYADLLAELRDIYAPEYELVVKARMTQYHAAQRRERLHVQTR